MRSRILFGVGHNDADYPVDKVVDGKRVICKFYRTWNSMLARCYYERHLEKYPTYRGCSVCDEWLVFSNFKAWMETQDWEGKELDKDLLFTGNKVYGPDFCIFVPPDVNKFLLKSDASRGEYPLGVSKHQGKFRARIRTLGGDSKFLGYFDTPDAAHQAWLKRKKEIAIEFAALQSDERIAKAILETRYEDWV